MWLIKSSSFCKWITTLDVTRHSPTLSPRERGVSAREQPPCEGTGPLLREPPADLNVILCNNFSHQLQTKTELFVCQRARGFFFVFAEFRAVARTHNCREFTRRILRKSPKDAHPPWGDRESLKGLFWKTVLNPCLRLFTLTGSSLLWMIYTWSIWLRLCPTVNRWRRESKRRRGVKGETTFIKLAQQQQLHEQNFLQFHPKVTFLLFLTIWLFFVSQDHHHLWFQNSRRLTKLKDFQAPLGITFSSPLVSSVVLDSSIFS